MQVRNRAGGTFLAFVPVIVLAPADDKPKFYALAQSPQQVRYNGFSTLE